MKIHVQMIPMMVGFSLVLAACASSSIPGEAESPVATTSQPQATSRAPADSERDYKIVTLLPRDAIPAIDDPVFLNAEEADAEYSPDEEVLGVVFDGEARAYSVPLLSSHEIVNDTVAGRKIAVTW